MEKKKNIGFVWKIATAASARLILNTARRFAYPFAPALSRGLGVPLTAITSIIAANQASGLLGLIFGPLVDRMGSRIMMLSGLGLMATGMLLAGLLPVYAAVFAGLFLAGMGKTIFDPALQAYVGQRAPFEKRGRFIGLIETSWAGSSLLGVPLVGVLIATLGWRAPFIVLGLLGIAAMLALGVMIPKEEGKGVRMRVGILRSWRLLLRERATIGALGFAFFISMANDGVVVVYGVWLEDAFNLSVMALGLGAGVIGLAELGGEFMTSALSDKMGLKRSIIVGLLLIIASYAILPLTGGALPLALCGLFMVFFSFEFTLVTSMALCTELRPESRGAMMAGFLAAAGVGRVAGAILGGIIWISGGLLAISLFAAVVTCVALVFLVLGLRGWGR
ncbi:MAG: MFS transporter [Desulfobacterales bacterium]|nr:MFS transporter [Desulfobacterales bacterium]